ncbi:MAG: FHIPEP family type III secretion protein [Candidatus Hermodarchaeota archaeon]
MTNVEPPQKAPNSNRSKLMSKYGDHYVSLLPYAIPIVIEIGSDLTAFIEINKDGNLSPKVEQLCKDIREDIWNRMGVKVPGFRFRTNTFDLQGTSYNVQIFENTVARDKLLLEKKVFTGNLETLNSFKIIGEEANHPITGNKVWMIKQGDWETLEMAGHKLIEPINYLLLQLQGVIENHLSEFLGHQEVANLLYDTVKDTTLYTSFEEILENSFELSMFTTILKHLVREKVPIKALGSIVTEFSYSRLENKESFLIIEGIRSLDDVRPLLPGNNDQYSFYQIGPSLEEEIFSSIDRSHPQPALIMEPQICADILTKIRSYANSQKQMAFVVKNAQIRPFLKGLIEIEFSDIPILSRNELLPILEDRILKEIDF